MKIVSLSEALKSGKKFKFRHKPEDEWQNSEVHTFWSETAIINAQCQIIDDELNEDWESIKNRCVEQYQPAAHVESPFQRQRRDFSAGFMAAVNMIAIPLEKENKKIKIHNDEVKDLLKKIKTDLNILKVAVNDKVNDPGATNFVTKMIDILKFD